MEYEPISNKRALFHFGITALFLILTILMMRNFVLTIYKEIDDKDSNYVQEYATIVRYKYHVKDSQIGNEGIYETYEGYSTYYEYIDENGKVYSGVWDTWLETEEEAKAQLGKKVPIFVDHEKGIHKQTLGSYVGAICFAGAFAFVFFVVMLNSLVRLILFLVHYYKTKNKPASDVGE